MTAWVDQLKESLPEYAKDTKLNLDAVLLRSTLDADVATPTIAGHYFGQYD